MELWPGYITSIRQHETNILLCGEISTKVMRMTTLHDILTECVQNCKDYKDAFSKEVIGSTVLTDYSNKTYRIDEVDFDRNPLSTFDTKDGKITFVEYFKKVRILSFNELVVWIIFDFFLHISLSDTI